MSKQTVINSTRAQEHPVADLMRARLAARGDGKLEVLNAAGPKATIRIYDYLDFLGITAEDVARQLDQITADEIEVQINSPGGVVFEGIAIFNALRAHSARVTTRVDGIAASAASIVAQAGDERIMLTGGQMMIHEAHGVCIGGANDMLDFAAVLEQQNDVLAGIYANRSGRPLDEMRQLMADETWFKDEATVEAGLADKVIDPPAAKKDGDKPANTSVLIPFSRNSDNNSITVEISTELLRSGDTAAIAAALRAIPDADPAPGVRLPAKDGKPDPDATPVASETDLLHALRGAVTQENNQ